MERSLHCRKTFQSRGHISLQGDTDQDARRASTRRVWIFKNHFARRNLQRRGSGGTNQRVPG